MAQVTAIPRNNLSSRFGGNDASSTNLANLEISEESPPKYDFGISLLINDKKIISKNQKYDNDSKEKNNDGNAIYSLSENADVLPATKMTAAVSNNISLGALAHNHKENNKTLSDWCSDSDFSLTNILSSDNASTSLSNVRIQDTENCLNFFDLCVNNQENSKTEFATMPENDVSFDLSELMLDSCGSINFCATDLTPLEGSYCQNNVNKDLNCKNGKDFTDAFLSSLKKDDSDDFFSFDSFHDILSKENIKDIESSTEIDVLNGLELSSNNNSKTTDKKKEFSEETIDDEQVPDIDLNFCIKKNVKDAFSIDSSSPNSVDSGFDEIITTQQNFISNIPDKNILYSDLYLHGKEEIKFKQSLFSRAMSARPKVDQERLSKLKQIRKEFFKKQFPPIVIDFSYQEQHETSDKIIDCSSGCIVTSNFLTISG